MTEAALAEPKGDDERLFRGLFEGIATAVLLRDVTTQQLLDVNEAGVRLYACRSRDELLGLGILGLSPERQRDSRLSAEVLQENLKELFARGSHRFEWLARKVTGEEILCDVNVSLIDFGGRRVIQALVDDVTDRRAAEELAPQARGP